MSTELKPHAFADCFPMLSDSELEELAADIEAQGLHQKIMLYEGKILDGRNRYAACQKVGFSIANAITQYEGSDPIGYVISMNIKRRHLGTGQRAMIAEELATATVGGNHSTKSVNGIPVSRVAKQINVGTTSITTARSIRKADPEVAAEVKAGRMSLAEGAKRAGVVKKSKLPKTVAQPERSESSEVLGIKAEPFDIVAAEPKGAPLVHDAISKEEKLANSFWGWVESHDPDNLLAIDIALQQIFAQKDLGDLAIAGYVERIVSRMDLEDLREIVAIKELEEADAREDVGAPDASGSEMVTTRSESQQADIAVEVPAVSVDTPITTPKVPRRKPLLNKEAQTRATLQKELDALKALGTLTQESQTKRDDLVNQIRTIELHGYESWKKTYDTPAPAASDLPAEDNMREEADQQISIPIAELETSADQETVPVLEQSVTIPTGETKTVREQTRQKLERAFGKSGNPRGHNVEGILNALEAKGWDIRKRQEQTLADTLAKCETIEALMKVFANNAKKVIW
jgi:hypothetical protein